MLMVELIAKKQRGGTLTSEEISTLIRLFTRGDIPDYQMAALLMATYFRGLDDREGRDFLRAMIESGRRLSLSSVAGIKVDKHSTGGVGDKTSLIVAPVVAALGVPVPMISGRALGHTGGTLDKLECIPGFRVRLDDEEFERILTNVGLAFGAQTDELVPADRRLYALRDVTSTVAIPPLIAASILSKKIAEGANALVMDVKVGDGGFLETEDDARRLSETLVRWSADENVRTVAFGTDMTAPLGTAAGNAPEVVEALRILKTGAGDARLIALCTLLGGAMLYLGGKAASRSVGERQFETALQSGIGWEKMCEVAAAQGSSAEAIEQFEKTWQPRNLQTFRAQRSGYVGTIGARETGLGLVDLGAGRRLANDAVDHSAGIVFNQRIGDSVRAGDLLATAYWSTARDERGALSRLNRVFERCLTDEPPLPRPLLLFYCDSNGTKSPASDEQ